MKPIPTPIFGPYDESFDGDDREKKYKNVPVEDFAAIEKHIVECAKVMDVQDVRLRHLETALKIYAEPQNYAFKKRPAGPMGACGIEYQEIMIDRGALARDVLARLPAISTPLLPTASTPAAKWREEGKPDPHGNAYNGERAQLCYGDLTDDEIANAVFMEPTTSTATGAKERIGWLSRNQEKHLARIADLVSVLKQHHQWHMQQGDVSAPDGKGGYITWDAADAYIDSGLWSQTTRVLSGTPCSGTDQLIDEFAFALKVKLHAAAMKYGYGESWRKPDWMDECREKLIEHIAKGDPRDVAAYCAFLWFHKESTSLAPAWPWVPITQKPDLEQFDGHENNFLFYSDKTGTYEHVIVDLPSIDAWDIGITAGESHYLVLDSIPAAAPKKPEPEGRAP